MNITERDERGHEEEEESRAVVILDGPDQVQARDDEAIIAMMTGQAIGEYVYAFRQGGKVVEGLTLAGINEAANRRGGIQVEEVRYEDRENSWIVVVKATDTFTGSSRYGAYEQPKKVNGREDPFAFTKAVHKAQRNAIKQLLPTPVIKEVLSFYLRKQKASAALAMDSLRSPQIGQPEEPSRAQEEHAPEKEETIPSQQKAAFSLAQSLRERFEKRGISQNDFWNYVRRRFGVQSRNDMSEEHWARLSAELRGALDADELFQHLVKAIERVLHAEKSSEVVPKPSEESVEPSDRILPDEKMDSLRSPQTETPKEAPAETPVTPSVVAQATPKTPKAPPRPVPVGQTSRPGKPVKTASARSRSEVLF